MLVSMHRVSPHTFTHLHTPAARFISPTLIVGTVGETLVVVVLKLGVLTQEQEQCSRCRGGFLCESWITVPECPSPLLSPLSHHLHFGLRFQ